ncbi:hypothetical protein LEP1GSC021_1203 [Leptospira noguchii str. 1993005606]|nr:hypothetical protein [Leptospira noguchii]EPE84517.1 hypothetical protein LEP1GSC021_1203 [Leptospira noguchii str. 1993005606]
MSYRGSFEVTKASRFYWRSSNSASHSPNSAKRFLRKRFRSLE